MFDIGWSEMLVIGVVALVVIGPKELPSALKTFAYWMKQARKMAREFQSGVDDLVRQAELDEAKKAVEDARRNLNKEIETAVDPTGEVKQALSDNSLRAPTPGIPVNPPKPAASGNGNAPSIAEAPAAPAPADAGAATQTSPAASKSA
ncbi:MAG: Sec-independent protein translocase protein TatB [Dongiaceae bacterium]